MMWKSDFLDELRLQVGLVYDYAQNKEEFLKRVFEVIHEYVNTHCSITIYAPESKNNYKIVYHFGSLLEKKQFGVGFLSLCRQQTSFLITKKDQKLILAPIFSRNDQLEYVVSISIISDTYKITQQDIDFVNELIRFIEVKRESFIN